MIRHLLALLFAVATASALAASPEPRLVVPGEPALGGKAAPVAKIRLDEAAPTVRASLSPVTEAEVETVRRANRATARKRVMIGVNRPMEPAEGATVSATEARWVPVAGGHAARLALTSPGALALRLAIDLRGTPLAVEMVFLGSGDASRPLGPVRVGEVADRFAPWWSPPTEGETQTVEVFVPAGTDPRSVRLSLAQASHLFTSAASRFTKRAQDIGESGSCNVDIACLQNPSQAFLNVRLSVAKMLFTSNGGSGLCTGTLLNDADPATQVPWFHGANHCFDNDFAPFKTPAQMQQVASTLTTYWFFEAATCGSLATPNFVTRTGGATLVYNDQPSDVLFLRLNESPPGGSFFSGYSAQAFAAGQTATGIHHPQGDLKKVSQGNVLNFSTPYQGAVSSGFTELRWFTGTTEAGSSGSGVWHFDGNEYFFRGALWGGSALCSNPQGTDNYSRFDLAYSVLRQYLEFNSAPFADFTDLWWGGPSESGWGLNLIQHPNNQIFGVWYTYEADGTRTWYVMSGGNWTSSSTFTGDLYATSGPPYNVPFNTANVHVNRVGTGTLNFSSAEAGTWTFSINGINGVKTIVRQPF